MHTVLLIDDAEETAAAARKLFKRFGVANPLTIVNSAEKGIEFLSSKSKRAGPEEGPKAKIVIIDLHLAECQAFSLLQWIKSQPALKNLLRIVLVERSRLKEVVQAYEMGAHTFLVKPLNPDDLKTVFESFPAPWIFVSPSSSC